CKLFPLLGKLSTVSVFLGFGLTFAGTSKYWGVLRMLMISLRLIPLVNKDDTTMIASNGEFNTDFHPMVDFIATSPLRYALIVKPTIFVSHIRQFWSTARFETTDEGTHILATVDGIQRTVSESSLRYNLKLRDEDGIVSIPDGGEGSGTPTKPHHTPFLEADTSHLTTLSIPLPSFSTAHIPPVTQTDTTPIRQYLRRARIAQSFALPTVADELASPVRDVSKGEACPTESGFIADQDRTTIAKSSTLPHDSAPMAQEVEILRLKERVQVLEDKENVAAKQSRDDAPINGRSINEREAAAERISNDSEEIARVLTSMDAATVLAGGIDVPTGSGSIPTVGPPAADIYTGSEVVPTASAADISTGSEVVPTASLIVTSYSRRKGKEVMVESDTPKKQRLQEQIEAQVAKELEEKQEKEHMRMNEQIARDAKVARIHAEEELQGMIDSLDRSNETIAKYFQEYQDFALELPLEKRIELISDLVKYQENYSKVYKFQSQQRRPMTKKQERDYYMAMIRNNLGWKVKDFKGSKKEAERLKRKGLNLEQEHVKKQKTSEEAPEIEKSTELIFEEKMKEMMQLVPVEDIYVQALQVKHLIIDWKVHTKGQRSYWKIIGLGGNSACYQYFIDLLKQLDMEDLNQLWALVKEYLSIRPATSEKDMELWVKLKRLYEPDPKDQLWAQTQNYMHAPTEWKLYDLSGVYHVTAKDKEIFMLVEKDYPLRKGLALVMISYKLQVKNYSQMAEDLIRKIYNIANTLRQQGD
nr:hypothetical protein [Tanacetum cinerariifolium]